MRIDPSTREMIVSMFHTFVSASILEATVQYHLYGNVLPTKLDILIAIVLACVRAGWKAVAQAVFKRLVARFKPQEYRYEE